MPMDETDMHPSIPGNPQTILLSSLSFLCIPQILDLSTSVFAAELRRDNSVAQSSSRTRLSLLLQSPSAKFLTNPDFFTVLHSNPVRILCFFTLSCLSNRPTLFSPKSHSQMILHSSLEFKSHGFTHLRKCMEIIVGDLGAVWRVEPIFILQDFLFFFFFFSLSHTQIHYHWCKSIKYLSNGVMS